MRYGLALSFFQRWQTRGVRSIREMTVQLAKIAGNQAKLDWLREQCEMRVIGLSFNYKLQWGSSKDEDIGTVEDLTGHLKEILEEEQERRGACELPDRCPIPTVRRKTFKELGTPTLQAKEIASRVQEYGAEELLERAERERVRLEEAGEIDRVADENPEEAPPCDDSLVGAELEICWRYWLPYTDASGRQRRKGAKMWCLGTVVQVCRRPTSRLPMPLVHLAHTHAT